jgi:propionyl-CoA synthetase
LAGERCDNATLEWFNNTFLFLIDHWWQTESGWPMIANSLGIEKMPVKSGSATKAVCGYDIRFLMKTATN